MRRLGITTAKSSPDLMMVVHMLSPDNTYDQLYVSNYARSRVRDVLLRLDGVGDLIIFGEREYSLRIWLDPEKLSAYGMTAGDVVESLREQNVQVSGGLIGAPPTEASAAFQYTVTTQGRFDDARDFRYVIVKSTDDGRLITLEDVARIELGAKDYITNSYLNGKPAVALAIFQRPGTNALATADSIIDKMTELSRDFPPGLGYEIVYNPTEFISESINEVYKTILEAVLLVVIVIIVFLQSWRMAIVPIVAIPVSLIGTLAVLLAFGFSLNMLTLFGLVLAIGIVVDDAIVVVENVERNIASGMSPNLAAHRTMDEVGTAVIGISLVLIAVFVPTAFIPGISGQFYLQFAITIAVSTAISAFNSLTLSPALAALLFKPHHSRGRAATLLPGAVRPGAGQRVQSRLRQARRISTPASSASWSDPGSRWWRRWRCSPASSSRPSTWRKACRAASSRRSTRAMRSSSSSCPTAPRCRGPTRSSSRRRRSSGRRPASRTRWRSRAFPAPPSPTPAMPA